VAERAQCSDRLHARSASRTKFIRSSNIRELLSSNISSVNRPKRCNLWCGSCKCKYFCVLCESDLASVDSTPRAPRATPKWMQQWILQGVIHRVVHVHERWRRVTVAMKHDITRPHMVVARVLQHERRHLVGVHVVSQHDKESTAAVHNRKSITAHETLVCCIAPLIRAWLELDRGFDSRRRNLAEILQCATQSSEIGHSENPFHQNIQSLATDDGFP
jgi:hypothetical protein